MCVVYFSDIYLSGFLLGRRESTAKIAILYSTQKDKRMTQQWFQMVAVLKCLFRIWCVAKNFGFASFFSRKTKKAGEIWRFF